MDRDRMNGIFILVSMLHVEENYRYDILPNHDYAYSLVLSNCDDSTSETIIDHCSPDDFCKRLLELRDKENDS